MRKTRFLVLLAALAPVQCSAQQSTVRTAEDPAATITAEDVSRRVHVIAHDSMRGRETPSAELDQTAEWVASEFRRLGLTGGAESGAFIQRYPLRATTLTASVGSGSVALVPGADHVPARGLSGEGGATAGVVVLSGRYRPGDALSAAEVRGRHAVVVLIPGATGRDRSTRQLVSALGASGAESVVFSHRVDDATWGRRSARSGGVSFGPAWSEMGPPPATSSTPVVDARSASLTPLLAEHGVDLARLGQRADGPLMLEAVSGLALTVSVGRTVLEVGAPNVVAVLAGSDPDLRSEHVVFSAHMDHVGVGAPDANGDSIFNGADDDASGTAAVLEVAEAMAALPTPPRRSMVFLIVSGEEKGLWGSEWYADHPSVPAEDLVANLNLDMVGRNWPDTIVAIGKEHSDLGATLDDVNRRHPELGMTAIDDLWPDERFYFRSDHFNFARKGVPVLFFFNGTHDDYHGRDDEPDRIDAEKAARIARLVFYLGMEIANADERPRWNPESYARIVGGN